MTADVELVGLARQILTVSDDWLRRHLEEHVKVGSEQVIEDLIAVAVASEDREIRECTIRAVCRLSALAPRRIVRVDDVFGFDDDE